MVVLGYILTVMGGLGLFGSLTFLVGVIVHSLNNWLANIAYALFVCMAAIVIGNLLLAAGK